MYQIRLNLWSLSFKYTPPSFDLSSHYSSCLNKNLFKPLTFLTSLPTVLSNLPGPDQKGMWFFSKLSWAVILAQGRHFCLVDVGLLLFAVISLQWCGLFALCVPVPVLLLPLPDSWLPNCSPYLLLVCRAGWGTHLSSLRSWKSIGGILSLPTAVSFWAGYWCILSRVVLAH